jgi:hypothetical protein
MRDRSSSTRVVDPSQPTRASCSPHRLASPCVMSAGFYFTGPFRTTFRRDGQHGCSRSPRQARIRRGALTARRHRNGNIDRSASPPPGAWNTSWYTTPVLNDEGSSHPVDPAATGREHCFRPPCSHWNDPPVSMSSAAAPGGAGSATTTAPQLHEVFGVSRSSLGLLDRTRG